MATFLQDRVWDALDRELDTARRAQLEAVLLRLADRISVGQDVTEEEVARAVASVLQGNSPRCRPRSSNCRPTRRTFSTKLESAGSSVFGLTSGRLRRNPCRTRAWAARISMKAARKRSGAAWSTSWLRSQRDVCLKVGKAGPKSHARSATHHYGASAPSTLAQSILADRRLLLQRVPRLDPHDVAALTIDTVGQWLRDQTLRLHILLPAEAPDCALAFAEAFTQCRLRPVYEG